ncbi:cathepsin L1 [Folsomia candida]|nr:cathepsin L1 [Folsomia candida]
MKLSSVVATFVVATLIGVSYAQVQVLDVDEILGAQGVFNGLKVPFVSFGAFDAAVSQAVSKFSSVLQLGALDAAYANFASKFGKSGGEGTKNIFKTNILEIFGHNLNAKEGRKTFTMGVNKFSDLTLDQVKAKFTGAQVPNITRRDLFEEATPVKLPLMMNRRQTRAAPASKDWRDYGIVTKVKNQGGCGSCTDFANSGALESAMALYKGTNNLDLSEQELVDCPANVGRCNGNNPDQIFEYQKAEGQVSEASYPYEAKVGSCRNGGKTKLAKVSNFYRMGQKDENTMKEWLATYGPLTAIIEVNNDFYKYKSGVFTSPCSKNSYDHAVMIVGYGSEGGNDYWIVKNSWADNWGDKGYIKMLRNKSFCMIDMYPILAQA